MQLLSWIIPFLTFIVLTQTGSVIKDEKVRYDNHVVYKIKFSNVLQRQLLLQLAKRHQSYNVWNESPSELHLMVSPKAISEFEKTLNRANATAEIFIPNVQVLIDNEHMENSRATSTFGWKRYNNLAEIEAWLDEILEKYSDVTEGFVVGTSYEGRTIRGIKISYKEGNPGVFIESNIHAREWITSATATWLINELLSSEDELIRELAENHDWYFVPVLNVDGFVYTHEKDRMWRKTRQPVSHSTCIGADANRNFDVHWMENGGASDDPCQFDYAGTHPFSEPEVKGLAEYLGTVKDKVNVLLAFHSYSQVLLSPYGHTDEEVPDNFNDLLHVAKAYADAVEALPYGTNYLYGSTAKLLYMSSGATNDYAYQQGIEIAYTVEMRDRGTFAFVLPPAFIIPNAEETLIGIIALLAECKKLGYLALK
ncbi:zinc carboxypeptidase-like [Drosophila albomicans]|uniref:Zinc carboxypeptidase-like n=1 Tax=Drosophila albomicans TaxID=7291 RepID=A0A6P8XLK4_DROAB|nr:zinc carboxypeptidase-like [Drosophila albomicans]